MVLGIFSRNPVPGLRKKYDRLRERADRAKDRATRLEALRILDQVEPTLVALEEQEQPKFERRRMLGYVKSGLGRAGEAFSEPGKRK